MIVFADPTLCPDCRSTIPSDPERCPNCALPLRNSTASELFRTLQHADVLLDRLRSQPVSMLAPLRTSTATAAAYPAPAPREAPDRPGLRGSSVPSILLGLGALCLLAAALTFLAVAWSWLGVGGRTTVLVVLTATAAAAGVWWARRGLRVAGESLTTVALGLLTLDLFGAADAGWLASTADSTFVPLVGCSLALSGLGLAFATRRETVALIAPQLIGTLGVFVSYAGLRAWLPADLWISGVSVGVIGAVALAARPYLVTAAWALAGVTVVIWFDLLGSSLSGVPSPLTFPALWSGVGWALLASAAYLAAPALIPALRSTAQFWMGGAAVLATFTLALPVAETSADGIVLTALVALGVWTGVAWVLPRSWTWAARLPALAAAAPAGIAALSLLGVAAAQLVTPGAAYSGTISTLLPAVDTPFSPWLLTPTTLLLTGLVTLLASDHVQVTPVRSGIAVLAATTLSGTATLSLFPVAIWTVSAAIVAIAVPLVILAAARQDRWALPLALASGPLFIAALVVSRPSAGLVTVMGLVLTASAAYAALGARSAPVEAIGHAALPVSLAIALFAAGEVLEVSETYRAVAVILVLGAAAIDRARADFEISAAVSATLVASIAVTGAEAGAGELALLLTLAGALVSISALLNPQRRMLGWVGGAMLATATWVRLADLGVGVPEAYTLPSALALLAVGGWRLRQDPSAPTARLLGPGLVLATLPSLLWTLNDPIALRAALLGAGTLALVLGGSALRWNAPLVIGSTVGSALVLIEIAPYAAQTPQWVLIGLAGTILTAVGVTWESRMQDVRHAEAYLGRLR